MNILVTSDLHLTDNPRDEYRWGLFAWLVKQIKKHDVHCVNILGDLTDAKDRHSAALVSRVVMNICALGDHAEVDIVKGNHDYIDEGQPFFGFADRLKARHIISFYTSPDRHGGMLFLPNTRNYKEAWAGIDFNHCDYIFCHQTFDGAISETGFKLDGIPPSFFAKTKAKVWSGDIHKPQKIGKNIEYCGAPYRIRFGDDFKPRVVLLKGDGTQVDLHYPCSSKGTVDFTYLDGVEYDKFYIIPMGPSGYGEYKAGDQVKVRIHMRRKHYAEWPAFRADIIKQAKEQEIVLTGPELVAIQEKQPKAKPGENKAQESQSPLLALSAYAKSKRLPAALTTAGEKLLKEAMK